MVGHFENNYWLKNKSKSEQFKKNQKLKTQNTVLKISLKLSFLLKYET